ncbi:hypothetical protein FB548_2254 [Pseudoxanthomonas sp. 3HH-4]|nr:hypothetical protein FB548_2254 [Pseudoxanthomonas sp. 3HH-4]
MPNSPAHFGLSADTEDRTRFSTPVPITTCHRRKPACSCDVGVKLSSRISDSSMLNALRPLALTTSRSRLRMTVPGRSSMRLGSKMLLSSTSIRTLGIIRPCQCSLPDDSNHLNRSRSLRKKAAGPFSHRAIKMVSSWSCRGRTRANGIACPMLPTVNSLAESMLRLPVVALLKWIYDQAPQELRGPLLGQLLLARSSER